jgi:hypothetical protein
MGHSTYGHGIVGGEGEAPAEPGPGHSRSLALPSDQIGARSIGRPLQSAFQLQGTPLKSSTFW